MYSKATRAYQQRARSAHPTPATIIRFPNEVRLPAPHVAAGPKPGPSIGVSLVLALILLIACLLWEIVSGPGGVAAEPARGATTAPRVLLNLLHGTTTAS
jgi:hypothetical protein